jgi:GTP-binding protein
MTGPIPDEAAEAEAAALARLEAGRLLFAQAIAFERGAKAMTDLPDADLPEIAFAGRSNVGKSSLVNALTGRKTLARASTTPGRTRELNFFCIERRMRLVDLPGYGYARAPKTEIAKWTALTRDYLRGRPGLMRVVLLIDARHGVKPTDEEVMTILDQSAVVYQLVLTKADKLARPALSAMITATTAKTARRPAAHPIVLSASAHEGWGIPELRAELADLALPPPAAAAV